MKKSVLFVLGIVLFLEFAAAISSDIGESYAPSETIIGKIEGNILWPISKEQVKLKRGHVEVGFEYDIKKLGDNYYIWMIAPANENTYTLVIENIFTKVNGVAQEVNYEKSFSVGGVVKDYAVRPGFVIADKKFELKVNLNMDASKTIKVDFPIERDVVLRNGINTISFPIDSVVGNQMISISVGDYKIPSYIKGKEAAVLPSNESAAENTSNGVGGEEICLLVEPKWLDAEGNSIASAVGWAGGYENGDKVYLEVSGKDAFCVGKKVIFKVYEDKFIDEIKYTSEPAVVNSYDGKALVQWKNNPKWYGATPETSWIDNPKFYFNARIQGQSDGGVNSTVLISNEGKKLPVCGDGVVGENEVCEAGNLNGKTCKELGFDGGELRCSADCKSFNTGGCVGAGPICGDGVLVDGVEVCEAGNLNGKTCKELGFDGGDLSCNANCTGYNVSECVKCGNDILENGEICDGSDLNKSACLDLGFDGGSLKCSADCKSFNTGECFRNESAAVTGRAKPYYEFNPGMIQSKILAKDKNAKYSFEIINKGNETIKRMVLDYNKSLFGIYPDEIVDLAANESVRCNLKIIGTKERGIREVIEAVSYEEREYLLVKVDFTANADEVGTMYLRQASGESSLYYCSELGGVKCSADEVCDSAETSTLDGNCCLTTCEAAGGGGKGWIGYLILGIVVVALLIMFVKYRKAGKMKGSPLQERVAGIER